MDGWMDGCQCSQVVSSAVTPFSVRHANLWLRPSPSFKVCLKSRFYVADDCRWRQQRQIKTAGVQKRRRGVSVSIFGGKTLYYKTPYSTASVFVHQLHTVGNTLCLIYLSYSFISKKDMRPSSLVVLFSHFCLLADFMTHHLPVLLHLRAHICRDRIKQNGSAIKRLWHLSSHTS